MFKASKKIKKKQKIGKVTHKIFYVGLVCSLMLTTVPSQIALATGDGSNVLAVSSNANDWGRSDLRTYLNNGLFLINKNNTTKYYRLDSTYISNNCNGYAKQFNDVEYAMVQNWKYKVNTRGRGTNMTSIDLADKFLLPSANRSFKHVLSWGNTELSSSLVNGEPGHLIPCAYWPFGGSNIFWLRSPSRDNGRMLVAHRGKSINECCIGDDRPCLAGIFKVDLSSVIFASSVSASALREKGDAGKIEISGSSDFGHNTINELPDYGMYLKTKGNNNSSFSVNSLSLSGNTLTVNFENGTQQRCIVVHAFKSDDLTQTSTSYAAVLDILGDETFSSVDVSNWEIKSLDGYTVKVWMENDFRISLAEATMPQTFVGSNGKILKTTDGEIKNPRVFAMKNELQCSWGDLSLLSSDDYNKVFEGKATSAGIIAGKNPTNQKIYFGSKEDEDLVKRKTYFVSKHRSPLQFWIAGRESYDGKLDPNGDILCFYQAKSIEKMMLNRR